VSLHELHVADNRACNLQFSVEGLVVANYSYHQEVFIEHYLESGWTVKQLGNGTAVLIVIPPSRSNIYPSKNTQTTNKFTVNCDGALMNLEFPALTVYLFHPDQYDDLGQIAYASSTVWMGYETDYYLDWYMDEDERTYVSSSNPKSGSSSYYIMTLAGTYPVDLGKNVTVVGYDVGPSGVQTVYVQTNINTLTDVIAATGGWYSFLSALLSWLAFQCVWGFGWNCLRWDGYAPYSGPEDVEQKALDVYMLERGYFEHLQTFQNQQTQPGE